MGQVMHITCLFLSPRMNKVPVDEILVEGIRTHDPVVLESIYTTHFPIIEGFVMHNQGSREEAKDVFQEAMVIVYNKIRSENLELTCKFGTYLYAVCKKIWIQERKKTRLHEEKLRSRPMMVNDPGKETDPLLDEQLTRLFDTHFNALSQDCQKILSMYFNDHSVEEIRSAMKYKDLHHAADRKYRCKKSLIKRIMNDPLFKRLKDEIR